VNSFQISIPSDVLELLSALEAEGYASYIVGGCVRDSLIGLAPKDWDIATAATPEQIKAALPDKRILDTGIQHGTVTVLSKALGGVEITTFREDGEYADHRRPERVRFVDRIEGDLSRRDFTINAIAYSPLRGLADPFGGEKDLSGGVLRAVGSAPARLREDALRIMRALRFFSRFGFAVDGELETALHAEKALLKEVSAERLSGELMAMLAGSHIYEALMNYHDVLCQFIPEIRPSIGFLQQNPHHSYDVWEHTAYAVSYAKPDSFVRLCLLFHDLGKPARFFIGEDGYGHFKGHPLLSAQLARDRLKALRFDHKTVESAFQIIAYHDARLPEPMLKKLMGEIGIDTVRGLLEVRRADGLAHVEPFATQRASESEELNLRIDEILASGECYSLKGLAVKGDDLIALGIPKGPVLGTTLSKLLEMVLYHEIANEKSELLQEAKKLASAL